MGDYDGVLELVSWVVIAAVVLWFIATRSGLVNIESFIGGGPQVILSQITLSPGDEIVTWCSDTGVVLAASDAGINIQSACINPPSCDRADMARYYLKSNDMTFNGKQTVLKTIAGGSTITISEGMKIPSSENTLVVPGVTSTEQGRLSGCITGTLTPVSTTTIPDQVTTTTIPDIDDETAVGIMAVVIVGLLAAIGWVLIRK